MKEFPGDWIRHRLQMGGHKVKDLADFVGTEPNKITKALNGVRRFTADEILAIQDFFDVRLPGGSSLVLEDAPDVVPAGESVSDAQNLVTVYDVSASAGHGTLVKTEELTSYSLAFPPGYLKKLTRSNPENLSIISVKGDSMEPTLHDDDIVMLDFTKNNLNYDGLFVLRFGETLHVKRIARSAKREHVKIISDNRDVYPSEDIHLNNIKVVGKVIWRGSKI